MQFFRGIIFLSALTIGYVHAVSATDEIVYKQAKELSSKSLRSDLAYKIIESLTTEVGQRQAGSEAEKRARDWGVAKFIQLGFENVRVEPFEVDYWQRNLEQAEIISPFPQKLIITALGGSVATPASGLTGEIVIFPTLQALKDAPMEGLEDKIVFVDRKSVV